MLVPVSVKNFISGGHPALPLHCQAMERLIHWFVHSVLFKKSPHVHSPINLYLPLLYGSTRSCPAASLIQHGVGSSIESLQVYTVLRILGNTSTEGYLKLGTISQ